MQKYLMIRSSQFSSSDFFLIINASKHCIRFLLVFLYRTVKKEGDISKPPHGLLWNGERILGGGGNLSLFLSLSAPLYLCVCMSIHMCICAYLWPRVCAYMVCLHNVCVNVSIYMKIHMHMCMWVSVCTFVCLSKYVCTFLCTCICVSMYNVCVCMSMLMPFMGLLERSSCLSALKD